MLLSLLFMVTLRISAQELKFRIEECYQDQMDQAAQKENRLDEDGKVYAIIKVTSDLDGDDLQSFQFDFHNLAHTREMRDGELWLFVQRNAKNVTIRRNGYKTVQQSLDFTIKAGMTYRMKLAVQAPIVTRRGLQFKVTDKDGKLITTDSPIVKVKPEGSDEDYQLWGAVDNQGTKDKLIETGVYLYEVSAINYKTSQGRVSLGNGTGTLVETVRLTPNFGYLEIADDYGIAGAVVYINNAKVGTVPYKSDRMECRDDYQLMISNGDLYKTYNATFAIRQGETTKLSPRLQSNFAETTIRVDGNAEIYIDGTLKGRGSWTGPLKAGVYNIECRLTNHVTSKKQITVKPNEAATFTIDKPKPIEGSLYVSSTPSGAQIYVDGTNMGLTPTMIEHVLIGSHRVLVRLVNHKDEEQMVNIREGETMNLNVKMSDIATMKFQSNPSGADLYIDGKWKGTTPYTEEMPSGDYDIKLTKRRCSTYHKKVHLDGSNPERTFKLPYQYQWKHQFYMQPMMQVGQYMGAGMAMGCYLGNFNLEGDFLYGLGSEKIWWNPVHSSYQKPRQDKIWSMYFGGKLGYGVIIGARWRITPQLGVGSILVNSDNAQGHALVGSFAVRGDVALTRHIGLVLSPEYRFALAKSETFNLLSAVSSKVKRWAQGINLGIGLNFYF